MKKIEKIRTKLKVIFDEFKLDMYILKLIYLSSKKEFIITECVSIYQVVSGAVQMYILMNILINIIIEVTTSKATIYSSHLLVWAIVYAILTFINSVLGSIYNTSINILSINIRKYIDNILLRKISDVDLSLWENPDEMTKMEKIYSTHGYIFNKNGFDLLGIFNAIIGIFVNISLMFTISPYLIILIIIPSVFDYVNARIYGNKIWSLWDTNSDDKKNITQAKHVFMNNNIKVEMKINNTSNYFLDVYNKFFGNFFNEQLKAIRNKLKGDLIIGTLNNVITLSIYSYILFLVLFRKTLQVGNFTYLISNIGSIQGDFSYIFNTYGEISSDLPFVKDFYDFMNSRNEIKSKEGSTLVERTNEGISIEFQNVWFKYPSVKGTKNGKYVLKGVSFKIESGKSVSIVGVNGAGKTTIVRLLLRIFDPDKGSILVNGVDIKDINLESYYKLVGILMQEFGTYWLNIKENIKLGDIENKDEEKSEELVKSILDNTGLSSIVKDKLPNGVETMLSSQFSGGVDLSGGEWQKVAIGRVMYKKPKLLVLDEPTSAIDALNEELLFRKIEEEFKGKSSVLIISHRFSTVRTANKIIVIDNGRVKEEGTHEELMNIDDGMYKRMFETQAKGYM